MAAPYARGRATPRRIMCPKCGAVIDLSGEAVFSLAPKKPTSLEEMEALFSASELEMLEIGETSKAYTIKPKIYLGRKAFSAISDVVRLVGGHFFSAGKASKFIIPKEQEPEQVGTELRAMIESYDFGRIVVNGRKFGSDVVIFQERISANWWRKEGHTLSVDDVREIVDMKPEVLVVGTGYSGLMKIDPRTEEYLRSSGIELIADKTEKACKIYNELSKTRRVVAALHLTC